MTSKYPKYPKSVVSLCVAGNGWIIGSALYKDNPPDYDIVIPFSHWHAVAPLIPPHASPNTFGGWSFTASDGAQIDIWPDDLVRILLTCDVAVSPLHYRKLMGVRL